MAQKQWVWNKWYWGLSDNTAIVSGSDQTKYANESYAVDGRKNPEGIQLGSSSTSSEYSTSGDVTSHIDLSEYVTPTTSGSLWIVAITKTGNVYFNWNATPIYTFTTSSKEIYSMEVMYVSGVAYLYFFSTYWINRAQISTTNLTLSSFIENHISIPVQISRNPQVTYNFWGDVYISNWYTLDKLSSSEVLTQRVFSFSREYIIRGITYWQGFMNIYGSSKTNGIKAMWNPKWVIASGNEILASYIVPYIGKPILGVSGEGSVDTAVMGNSGSYSDLYALQGTSLPQLLVSNTEGGINQRTFNGIIEVRNGIYYLWGQVETYNCLFSYGKYINGFPNSLQIECRTTGVVTSIFPRSEDILFWNWPRSWIIINGNNSANSKYTDIWEVVSLPFTGGKRSLKSFIDAEVCFKTDSLSQYDKRGGNVTIYARTTPSSSWTTIRTINTTTETEGYVIISQQEMGALASFNQLEWRLRLEYAYDGSRYSLSPLITSITTRYDDWVKGS